MNKLPLAFLFLLLFQSTCFAQFVEKTDKNTTESLSQKVTKKTIIIYGSPDCHHCIDTKKWLTDHKIDFIFCDIDHDKNAVREMLFKLKVAKIPTNNLGIPVIDKNGEMFQNKGDFDDFLNKLIE